ncbi:putative protein HEADING DATE [Cocos nucifera]|nr:putative protein HEADING DATE [Cocos nucifera]
MVKGGKEEEKIMNPMFPRLHVNDTDKGGPRAPPRNKMALYEQLSIPSHRSNSTAASVLPLPPHNASILVSTASSQNLSCSMAFLIHDDMKSKILKRHWCANKVPFLHHIPI